MGRKKGGIPWNKGLKGAQTGWNKGLHIWATRPHPKGMLGKIAWNKGLKGVQVGWGKGQKRKPLSEATKLKMGLAHKGKKITPEQSLQRSLSQRGTFKPNLRGEKNPRWIKDRSKLKRFNDSVKDRRSSAYAYWRKQVWLRDNFKCKIANPDCEGRIEAHHILSWRDFVELRYQISNGITLCHFHHPLAREEEERLIPEFQALVSVSKETT